MKPEDQPFECKKCGMNPSSHYSSRCPFDTDPPIFNKDELETGQREIFNHLQELALQWKYYKDRCNCLTSILKDHYGFVHDRPDRYKGYHFQFTTTTILKAAPGDHYPPRDLHVNPHRKEERAVRDAFFKMKRKVDFSEIRAAAKGNSSSSGDIRNQ